jgi:hypothetical protein
MTSDVDTPLSWWGKYTLECKQNRIWNIGPLTLIVRCLAGEWQVANERADDFNEEQHAWLSSITDLLPETLENNSRYVFHQTSGLLNIRPLLADRPIISRPYTPFYLTAGEEVTVYVSTPLWLELSVGSKSKKLLEEIAIQRPSDTWFGPSTREGDLCYASSTHCRLDLEELPQRPYRAITPVHICNKADTTLAVERLNVPAPLLPLYASSKGQLWTPKITLIRDKDGDMAELVIDNKPPKEAVRAVKLSEPRETVDEGVLFRAFNAVFS